jgi:hypothetical protein
MAVHPSREATSAFDSALQLPRQLISRRVDGSLQGFGRAGDNLVERLVNCWLSDHDQRRLVAGQAGGHIFELFARQRPEAEFFWDDTYLGPIHPLDDMRLPVLVIDDGRVECPDTVILVKLFNVIEVGPCGVDAVVNGNVEGRILVAGHFASLSWKLLHHGTHAVRCRSRWPVGPKVPAV